MDKCFEQYINSKYSEPTGIHHYVTLTQYNDEGRIFFLVVIKYKRVLDLLLLREILYQSLCQWCSISNYEYEVSENDKKREILVLKPELLNNLYKLQKKNLNLLQVQNTFQIL